MPLADCAVPSRLTADDAADEEFRWYALLRRHDAPPTDEELWGLVPDPDTDPPARRDQWQDGRGEVAAILAASRAGTAAPASPAGARFCTGGAADRLAPGPVLAGLAAREWADGVSRISDDALIGLMTAWRRLASWASAGEAAAVAELNRRRLAQVDAGADPELAEHVGDEIAPPLTLTMRAAGLLLGFAVRLGELPLTRSALAAGEIDRAKASVIVDELTGLDPAHARAVEAVIIGRAPGQTTGQLRAAARRAVLAADPGAARSRREAAQQEARVEIWDEPAGTAALAGRDLPPAEVLAADRHISSIARRLQAAGVSGTLDQLRACAYTGLLAGLSPDAIISSQIPDAPSPGVPGTANPDAPGAASVGVPDAASLGVPGSASPGAPDAANPGVPSTDSPGAPGGASPGVADAANPGVPGGASPDVADPGAASPRTAGQAEAGSPEAGSGQAGSPAAASFAGTVHLTMPLTALLDGAAPGEVAGFGPVSAGDAQALARQLAAHEATRWCITLTGQEGRALAHGCARLSGGAPGPRNAAGNGAGNGDWELAVTIRPFADAECTHRREGKGYQPVPSLRHLITVRQRTCSFPGCRRQAIRCDLDHTVPYERGGKTCECNLAPLCRAHHRAKQTRGWHLDQPTPGVLVWTLPHGRQYRVDPSSYPPGDPGTDTARPGRSAPADRARLVERPGPADGTCHLEQQGPAAKAYLAGTSRDDPCAGRDP